MTPRHIAFYADARTVHGSAQAAAHFTVLVALAARLGARLTLIDTVTPPRQDDVDGTLEQRLVGLRAGYSQATLAALRDGVAEARDADIRVLVGNPFLEVSRFVARAAVDLLLCFAPVAGAPGPVIAHLVRKCPCAVWVAGGNAEAVPRRLAVAIDRDIFAASEAPRAMATRLLDATVALTAPAAQEIHLLHAWEIYAADLLQAPDSGLDETEVASYVDGQRYSHRLWLEDVSAGLRERLAAAGAGHCRVSAHLLDGAAAERIPGWTHANAIDLLVFGTLGASTAPGLYIGNTAEALFGRCAVPLLALKPAGFHSPVTTAG